MKRFAVGRKTIPMVVRLGPGEDLLDGILDVCREKGYLNTCVTMGIGSLEVAKIYNPVPTLQSDGKIYYRYPSEPDEFGGVRGGLELLTVQGTVWHDSDNQVKGHIHISFSSADGHVNGGHIVHGCRVLTTTELLIEVVDGIVMTHNKVPDESVPSLDPETD